jgi:hypothetical protein
MSADTQVILRAIESATEAGRLVAAGVATELVTHTKRDDERFAELTKLVESVANDTKSLLLSRSYTRGVRRAVIATAGGVSALVAAISHIPTVLSLLKFH